jgi:hypothetical protein
VNSNITLFPGNNDTLQVAQLGHTLTFTGAIASFGGGASLTKTGAETVVLSGATTVALGSPSPKGRWPTSARSPAARPPSPAPRGSSAAASSPT